MHLLVLSILLQVTCAVHAVRTGRPTYWVFILLIGSYLGVLVYLLAEVLPEMLRSRGARQAVAGIRRQIDPERARREAANRLQLSDSHENRRNLAEQCLAGGDHAKALALYRDSLKGLYANDPQLLLGMARAQFELGMAAEARATIESLIASHPRFHSFDGHLLYARAIAATGDLETAAREYRTLADSFPGEEARVRYGQFLKQVGRADEARAVFEETVRRSGLSPKYYQREQKEWIAIARGELG